MQKPINDTDNLTIGEILRYSLEERKGSRFNAVGIDKVLIDGNEFTDYGAFSFLREKSYVKSPERSGDGSITNLNSYATFITPHLKIDFSLMSIDSYRRLMELLYSKNEFVVTCYDVVKNETTTNKMYFATEEMPKLWAIAKALNGEEWVELLGVQDYTVEMIGTNADLDMVDILYYDNNGNIVHTQTVEYGTEAIIDFTFTPTADKKFEGVWISSTGTRYYNKDVINVNNTTVKDGKLTIELTAEVRNDNQYTLSFNYGDGNTLVTQTQGDLTSITIQNNGETINNAIQRANITLSNGTTFTFPETGTGAKPVVYNGKTYEGSSVYSFVGWFWTNTANEQTRVTGSTVYNYSLNRTIYQIYEPIKHKVIYHTNTDGAISIGNAEVGYGETVYLPTLARSGYTHNGWYTTSDFKDGTSVGIVSTTMPPYELELYAKWVENK